jgi:dienelactone hydrolase
MPEAKAAGLTRRQVLKAGGAATFAGYAAGVEKALGHGFFADYRPSYNAEASADAWKRCTGLFARSLKA